MTCSQLQEPIFGHYTFIKPVTALSGTSDWQPHLVSRERSLQCPAGYQECAEHHVLEAWRQTQANSEKLRLEQKQRAARKAAEAGEPLNPRWFEKVPNGREGETLTYRYKVGPTLPACHG